MKHVLLILVLLLLQAELVAIVLGADRANQLMMSIVLRPAPPWDVFTIQPGSEKDI